MFEMLKLILLDILGIKNAPVAPAGYFVARDPGFHNPAVRRNGFKDYSYAEDRMGGFPVDRERVM